MKTFTRKDRSEVDIRVEQEIKNHQDFVYQTNQSLQSLSQGLIALSLQNEKIIKSYESEKKHLEIIVENLKAEIDCKDKQTKKIIDEFSLNIVAKFVTMNECQKNIHDCILKRDEFAEVIFQFNQRLLLIDATLDCLNSDIKNLNKDLRNHTQEKLCALKQELDKPCEVPVLEEKLDEKFQVLDVNFKGLVREIALLKKDVAYGEKKFENIYTLIERLKER